MANKNKNSDQIVYLMISWAWIVGFCSGIMVVKQIDTLKDVHTLESTPALGGGSCRLVRQGPQRSVATSLVQRNAGKVVRIKHYLAPATFSLSLNVEIFSSTAHGFIGGC